MNVRLCDGPDFAPAHRALADEAHAFRQQHLAGPPGSSDADTRALVPLLARAGLLDFCVPVSAGGRLLHGRAAIDVRSLAVLREELGHASALADLCVVMQALGSLPITLAGSDALKDAWLPRVRAGQVITAFALTEEEAGSDVANIQCRATLEGDAYVLRGEKKFISQATVADLFCVFARTSDDGGKGLSAFAVERGSAGLSVRAQAPMGPHPLGKLVLDGVRVPVSHRLGAEGQGMRIALSTLDVCRPTVAAAACGMARRALDESLTRTRSRRQFGKPLADQQLVQQKLARMATDLAAAALLTGRACHAVDEQAPDATLAVSQAKWFATEAAWRIIDDAVQLHGGDGVMEGSAVERLYRDIRALRIYEGTSEIQQLVIARALLKG